MGKKSKKSHKADREVQEEKPLRLVLKVGSSVMSAKDNVMSDASEGEQKHRHKKKKRKHKHEHREYEPKQEKRSRIERIEESLCTDDDVEEGEESQEDAAESPAPPAPTPSTCIPLSVKEEEDIDEEEEEEKVIPRSRRERKIHTFEEHTALHDCLDYLHKVLQRKDTNGFFAYPVTDNIAPLYSQIIKHPMDLSTMRGKIDNNEYSSVVEYKRDFKLMCENCMTYNLPDTIFFREAQKLLSIGMKQMSRDKLLMLKRSLPSMALITDRELGLDADEESGDTEFLTNNDMDDMHHSPAPPRTPNKASLFMGEDLEEELTPEEILSQAQAAAKDAADSLTLRQPHSTIGFLRRRDDGSTSFTILNPDNEGIVSEKERVVNMGSLVGKLKQGSPFLTGLREDRRNKATPANYLTYGPFSSYGPVYDSPTANLSKEDTDLLLSTYGDETGLQYSKSLQHFVADAGSYAVRMVDELLNTLTNGEHSKSAQIIKERQEEEMRKKREEEKKEQETKALQQQTQSADVQVDFTELRTLGDIGIDVSFLDELEKADEASKMVSKQLEENETLINELHSVQYDRLSQGPAEACKGPSSHETELAGKVTGNLTQLIKEATPGDVVSMQSLRKTMGVSYQPNVQSASQSQTGSSANQLVADIDRDLEDLLEKAASESDAALQQGCDSPPVRMEGDGDSNQGVDDDIIMIEDSN